MKASTTRDVVHDSAPLQQDGRRPRHQSVCGDTADPTSARHNNRRRPGSVRRSGSPLPLDHRDSRGRSIAHGGVEQSGPPDRGTSTVVENRGAGARMLLDALELRTGQAARLVEHIVGHRQFADVVQQRGRARGPSTRCCRSCRGDAPGSPCAVAHAGCVHGSPDLSRRPQWPASRSSPRTDCSTSRR